jgi:Mn-dependent DtxR family transcriptional regulator
MTQGEVYHLLKQCRGQKLTCKQIGQLLKMDRPDDVTRMCRQLHKYDLIKIEQKQEGSYHRCYYWV